MSGFRVALFILLWGATLVALLCEHERVTCDALSPMPWLQCPGR